MRRLFPRIRFLFCVLAAAGIVAASTGAHAASPAYARLRERLQTVRTLQTTVTVTSHITPLAGGQGAVLSSVADISYAAPNKVSIQASGGMGAVAIVSDGRSLYRYSSMLKQYTRDPAPPDLVHVLLARFANVAFADAGQGAVDGRRADIVEGPLPARQGGGSVTVWIDRRDSTILQILVDIPKVVSPRGGFRIRTTEKFSATRINRPLAGVSFSFVPPPGAERTGTLPPQLSGGGFGSAGVL